jgi:hypothetical protein
VSFFYFDDEKEREKKNCDEYVEVMMSSHIRENEKDEKKNEWRFEGSKCSQCVRIYVSRTSPGWGFVETSFPTVILFS